MNLEMLSEDRVAVPAPVAHIGLARGRAAAGLDRTDSMRSGKSRREFVHQLGPGSEIGAEQSTRLSPVSSVIDDKMVVSHPHFQQSAGAARNITVKCSMSRL